VVDGGGAPNLSDPSGLLKLTLFLEPLGDTAEEWAAGQEDVRVARSLIIIVLVEDFGERARCLDCVLRLGVDIFVETCDREPALRVQENPSQLFEIALVELRGASSLRVLEERRERLFRVLYRFSGRGRLEALDLFLPIVSSRVELAVLPFHQSRAEFDVLEIRRPVRIQLREEGVRGGQVEIPLGKAGAIEKGGESVHELFSSEFPHEFRDVSRVGAHPLSDCRLEAVLFYDNHPVHAWLVEEPREEPVEVAPPVIIPHPSNRGD